MSFKKAFQCKNCPETNGVNGCPCWWEMPMEHDQTGETTIKKGCILTQEMGLPIVQSIVKAAHTASEHSSKARNQTARLESPMREFNEIAEKALALKSIDDAK